MAGDPTKRVGRLPSLNKPWQEVVPELREFLNKLAQIVSDPDSTTADLGVAIAFFTGSSFAGASGNWSGSGGVTDGDKGDVVVTVGGTVWTIDTDAVSNTKLANMAQSTIKGRAVGAGTGDPTDLTGTQATAILDAFTGDGGSGGIRGLVPAPAAGDTPTKFLQAGGTWENPLGAHLRSSSILTNATPTPLFTIPVPSGGFSCGRAIITVQIDDGTDFEAATQLLDYAVVNKAGTLTRTLTALGLASAFSTGAGMALAYDTTTGTNEFTVRLQATAGIAPVTLLATWEVLDLTGHQPETP